MKCNFKLYRSYFIHKSIRINQAYLLEDILLNLVHDLVDGGDKLAGGGGVALFDDGPPHLVLPSTDLRLNKMIINYYSNYRYHYFSIIIAITTYLSS